MYIIRELESDLIKIFVKTDKNTIFYYNCGKLCKNDPTLQTGTACRGLKGGRVIDLTQFANSPVKAAQTPFALRQQILARGSRANGRSLRPWTA